MDVLIIHNSYQQHGGEDEVFRAEASLLASRGHRVVEHHVSNDEIHNHSTAAVALGTVWNQASYTFLRKLMRRERPQIVHLHNTLPLISPAAYYAARREGVPVIQTLHNYRMLCPAATLFREGAVCTKCVGRAIPLPGIVHRCYRGSTGATSAVAAMLAVHRLAGTWTRCVDRYLALTEWSRRLFVSAGLPEAKIQVKPNFVFPDPRDATATRERRTRALFVGRLAVEKGIRTLLRGWREIGDRVPLDIVGDGPLALEVDQATREMPGVRWLGALPRQEIYEAMAAATMLVAPSDWYEPFGLSVVEAYAMGLPVIASRTAGLEEIVRDGQTGLHFEPGDSGQLCARVMWMATHEEERRAMAQDARAEFEHRYTADSNYGHLMEAYRMAIGGRSRSRINDTRTAPIPGIRYFPA